MDTNRDILQQKNSRLSILLILVLMILVYIYTHLSHQTEDAEAGNILLYALCLTVFTGIYAFGYKGRAYRWARWLFALLLLITLAFTGLLWYATQLGHAFQH